MRKQIIIIALLIYTIQGFSQFSVFSKYLPYNQKTDVYTVTSNFDMGLPLIFISGRDVKIMYLNNKYKLQKEIVIKRNDRNSRLYLGSYFIDSTLIINFSNEKLNLLSQIAVNLNTGSYIEKNNSYFNEDMKFLSSWEVKDSVLVMGFSRGTNKLIVQNLYGLNSSLVQEFSFDSILIDSCRVTLADIFQTQEHKLQKIDTSIPVSLKISSSKNKVYITDDKIVITIDKQNKATYLLALNLKNTTSSITKMPYKTLQKHDQNSAKSNSFIYDNTLFQLSVNNYELGLNISSLDDSSTTLYYHFLRGDNISFSNSAMYERNEKEGFLFGDPVTWEIRTTRKFLKMLSGMSPAISVYSKHPDFQVKVGGVMDVHQAAGVMSSTVISSGGEMIVSPNGSLVMPDPKYNFPTNYSFTSYSSRISTYFSSMINATTLLHSNKSISKYTYDYIIEYANYMAGRQGLVTIFKINNDYYLGYYSYSDKTYNIEWFKNIDDFAVQY